MLIPLLLGCATVFITMSVQIAAVVYMLQYLFNTLTRAEDVLFDKRRATYVISLIMTMVFVGHVIQVAICTTSTTTASVMRWKSAYRTRTSTSASATARSTRPSPPTAWASTPSPRSSPSSSGSWAEVDFTRYKATGMTAAVDHGGAIPAADGWTTPSFGKLNPQPQAAVNPNTGNNLSRAETGPVLTQAMMLFLNQTNVIDWGKANYQPGENGGISGVVWYDTTRAEDDASLNGAETWQPGIPDVQVNLYLDNETNGSGAPVLGRHHRRRERQRPRGACGRPTTPPSGGPGAWPGARRTSTGTATASRHPVPPGPGERGGGGR